MKDLARYDMNLKKTSRRIPASGGIITGPAYGGLDGG